MYQAYQKRRQALAAKLTHNAIAIIPAARELLRNGDAHHRFRQDSDFYYLTGYNEPDALLLITSGPASQSILFNRPRDEASEIWTGKRLGQEAAIAELGMSEAYSIDVLDTLLPQHLAGKSTLYFSLNRAPFWDKVVLDALSFVKAQSRRGIQAPHAIAAIDEILGEMRLFKSEVELNLMRKAASISVAAHERAMKCCRPGMYEYALEAELTYVMSQQGCRSVAYDSIVGSGENACVLHYTDNNAILQEGQLLLVDAGGEYQNYASDITRTYPVNGRFSPDQRAIYEVVLAAQQAGIACIKPGLQWPRIQEIILEVLTQGLVRLGILTGEVDALIEACAYKPFYMHSSGHWLGLDVHDVGLYKLEGEWRALLPGMVLTVEPGLYIAPNSEGVDERWWGIGIRIEDDILVTEDGHENLTAALATSCDAIEALMRD